MKSKITALFLMTLLAITAAVPALAGGWATITLEALPSGAFTEEPLTVLFSVRQHGRTLMEGLTPTVKVENPDDGTKLTFEASPVSGKPGFYQAELTFPSSGTWEWSIQAFTMDQRMPDLVVSAGVPASSARPAASMQTALIMGGVSLGFALAALAAFLRKKKSWAYALLILGLLVGGSGIASASGTQQAPEQKASTGETVPAEEIGEALFVAKGCITCHTNQNIDKKFSDLQLEIGPNLTSYNAGPEYLRMWLSDPASVRPDTEMPDLELSEAEIEALIAFLSSASSQGTTVEPSSKTSEVKAAPESPAQKTGDEKISCSDLDRRQGLLVNYTRDADGYLALVDPSNGLPLCSAERIEVGGGDTYVLAADRSALAVLSAGSPAYSQWKLHWIDLLGWKGVDTGISLTGWSNGMAINPQHSQVAIAYAELTGGSEPRLLGYRLIRADVSQPDAVVHIQTELDISPRLVAFSGGGESILVYGATYDYLQGTSTSSAKVRLYNASDLSLIWGTEISSVLEGTLRNGDAQSDDPDQYTQWNPGLAMSPDGEKLYIVHADADRLTTVDLVAQQASTVDIQPRMGLFERFLQLTARVAYAKVLNGTTKQAVVSPDGKRLYVSGFTGLPTKDEQGNWQFDMQPFGLQVVDAQNGLQIARLENQAREVELTFDGKTIFLRGWNGEKPWTELLDAGNLASIARQDGQLLYAVQTLHGQSLVVGGSEGQWSRALKILEQMKLTPLGELTGKGYWMSVPR